MHPMITSKTSNAPFGQWVAECALLGILILASTFAYISQVHLAVRQSDPATYFYAGQRIAETGSASFCDGNNSIAGPYFTVLGFKVRRGGDVRCFYPNLSIGFPLLIASTWLLGQGPEIVPYLAPGMGLVGLVAVFVLGRALFDRPTGLLAAGLLAFNAVYWSMATEMWSDVPAMTCITLGIFVAVQMIERNRALLGFISGAVLGYACLIRYHSMLALLPLGLYFWSITRGRSRPGRALAGFGWGFGIFVLVILIYHKWNHGGFLRTGYGAQQGEVPWPRFSVSYLFGESPIGQGGYRAIWSTLVENFHVLGLLVAVVTMIVAPRSHALLVGGLVLVFCVFYAFYAWPATGLNARFLLPVFPMMFLAVAFGVVRCVRWLSGQREVAVLGVLPLVLLAWHWPSLEATLTQLENRNRYVETQVTTVTEFTQGKEPNAVFLSREYHDWIILYGRRSALLYSMLAEADSVSQRYQLFDYESKLVGVVSKLIEHDTPVYVVVEPKRRSFIQGPIDPYPILSKHFDLIPSQGDTDPAIYRVR
jgi:4-amino-4-deoxy-L-arabinose transferase-like glycosyltransferase